MDAGFAADMEAFLCRSEGGEEVETCGRGEDMLLCRSGGLEAVEDLAGAWEDGDIVTLLCRSGGLEAMEDLAGWGEDTGGMGTYGGATVNPKVMKVAGHGSRTRAGGLVPEEKSLTCGKVAQKGNLAPKLSGRLVRILQKLKLTIVLSATDSGPHPSHTHRLLQCLTVALCPLRVQQLAEVLAIDFSETGEVSKLNKDWRGDDYRNEAS